jgi:hypothetical protein
MGKGKGGVEYWIAQIKPGTMLYELQGVPETIKTGVTSGAEYRKHENWCHRWSRVPKT